MSNQPFVPDPRYSQADEPTLPDAASYAARQENVSAGESVDIEYEMYRYTDHLPTHEGEATCHGLTWKQCTAPSTAL